jgi:hypothetical protein
MRRLILVLATALEKGWKSPRKRAEQIRRAIIDKDVKVPPHASVGFDLEHDRQRGFAITEQGVVVIAKAELPECGGAALAIRSGRPFDFLWHWSLTWQDGGD